MMDKTTPIDPKKILSKVPEVTLYFWIIKILCTTVGETASDFLDVNVGLGLTGTSIIMGGLLLVALFFQLTSKKYIPSIYWLTVVLISIFGTLVTDNLTDQMGVALEISTTVFSIALAITFAVWFIYEKTLSIHSIVTFRREAFYWLAILFTFALGTASGDLMAESLGLGYVVTGMIICAVIIFMAAAWRLGLNAVLTFWVVYIMTRPLGASIGDYLSQSRTNGGLGLGATMTSVVFMSAILLIVLFLSITKRDLIAKSLINDTPKIKPKNIFLQVAAVISILVIASVTGYQWRQTNLQMSAPPTTATKDAVVLPLGDLSSFTTITEDTLKLVQAGKLAEAKTRVADLEYAWDNAEAHLKPMNREKWVEVDDAIDTTLRKLRAVHQDPSACITALQSLIDILNNLDKPKPAGT